MFTYERDFLLTGVAQLVANKSRLHVLFATYNKVGNYPDGSVSTGKEGLSIQVQNGNLQYSESVVFGLFDSDKQMRRAASSEFDREGQLAQVELESRLESGQPDNEVPFLAVVYAGLSAFREAAAMALRIKQQHPHATVVVTTCSCELDQKEHLLSLMHDQKQIEAVVVTSGCGGYILMAAILKKVIECFPAPVTSAVA